MYIQYNYRLLASQNILTFNVILGQEQLPYFVYTKSFNSTCFVLIFSLSSLSRLSFFSFSLSLSALVSAACPVLPQPPPNGYICSREESSSGPQVRVCCEQGYVLEGTALFDCDPVSERWEPTTLPQCLRMYKFMHIIIYRGFYMSKTAQNFKIDHAVFEDWHMNCFWACLCLGVISLHFNLLKTTHTHTVYCSVV